MSGPGQLADEAGRRALLQSIVAVTRTVFAAGACSIVRHDAAAAELVFEAVAGEGEDTLVGRRIPAGAGLAGWALASEQPIAVGNVVQDPRFARDIAESTGYVPERLTVYPLLHDEQVLGVLSILDQGLGTAVGLADMAVLGTIATHAASLLALVIAARGGAGDADSQESPLSALAGVEQALVAVDPPARGAALSLLAALEELLRRY